MDYGRAFTYFFDDHEWATKLLITAGIAFISILLTPFFVGLAGWALLLGYQADLIRNLRDRHPTPLPRWDRYDVKLQRGASVLTAFIVYNIPNVLPSCCLLATSGMWGDNFMGSAVSLGIVCCVFPMLIIYNLITWPMLALGMARYAEENNVGVFFQFGDLFGTVYRNFGGTLVWSLMALMVNFVLGLIAAIPCIGWAAAPALAIPIYGYLTAALAERVEGVHPSKRKR